MDQLSGCRVALQDAMQEIDDMRQALVKLCEHIEGVIHWPNTQLAEATAMVGVRTKMRESGLWRDAKEGAS